MKMKSIIKCLVVGFLLAVVVIDFSGCSSNDEPAPVDCNLSDLTLTVSSQTNPTSCLAADGKISVTATGGSSPYQYAINSGSFGNASEFTGLGGGIFVVRVKDANGCTREQSATLIIPGSTLAVTVTNTADTQCLTDNGVLSIAATGGQPPYQYRLANGAFTDTHEFTALKNGSHTVAVRDATGCTVSITTSVARGDTGTSYSSQVNPIITAKCATSSCHGGAQSPNWTVLANVQSNATNIKSRITAGSMPPSGNPGLTEQEKALIICWIDDGAKNN